MVIGDMTVQGTLTAKEFKTTLVSSSILFESGSTNLEILQMIHMKEQVV